MRLESQDMTQEDVDIWVSLAGGAFWASLFDISDWVDRIDAQLMYEQSRRVPGFAVINVRYENVVVCHNIAGRKLREEFERTRDPNWPRALGRSLI